ncbi:hypothetical protein CRENBAI_006814 [Crenichthys baileyi]|uniref:Uncharacterized protein n=1 Tax=Crenichthys baileyi TaxID=28760 RepID=A0AAV9SKD6_9TELE
MEEIHWWAWQPADAAYLLAFSACLLHRSKFAEPRKPLTRLLMTVTLHWTQLAICLTSLTSSEPACLLSNALRILNSDLVPVKLTTQTTPLKPRQEPRRQTVSSDQLNSRSQTIPY